MVANAEKISTGELPVSELGVSAPDKKTFVIELEQLCIKCGYAVKLLPTAALMTLLMIGCHLVAHGLKKASE